MQSSQNKLLLGRLLAAAILIIIYLPLLNNGGIITDDWGDIFESTQCSSFWQCYADWFPLFSNRPLAPLPITLTTRIFTKNYEWYLICNSAIYLSALFITANALNLFLSRLSRYIFVVLAAVPCIAMPVIVSPINQLTATVAFLYWAISIYLIVGYCQSHNKYKYFFSYLILLCGFLTYEIILPLLVLSAFIPALVFTPKGSKNWIRYFIKFIFPILAVLAIIIFWQKILAPNFIEVYSRLNFNPANIWRNLFTWLHLFAVQIPDLFIRSTSHISLKSILIALLLSLLIIYLNNGHFTQNQSRTKIISIVFVLISSVALASCALIFILTDESAVSWGYQARGLSSTWFALAMWIASLANLSHYTSKSIRLCILVFIFIFACFSILSFSIQRDKYIESWTTQLQIIKDIDGLMDKNSIDNNASFIFNVPRFVRNNYNRELVFSQSWDLPVAIAIEAKRSIMAGIVIDTRANELEGLRFEKDRLIVNDGGSVGFENLWLYDYDPITQNGSLNQIQNPMQLKSLLELKRN